MATSELPNEEFVLPKQKTIWDTVLRMLRKQPLGSAGALVIIIMGFAGLFAEQIAPFDPEMENFEYMLSPQGTVQEETGKVFYFGTDSFGRDQLTRMIYGARTALLVGFTASFCGAFLGLVLGVASAYFGGTVDLVLQRVCDVFMAFPLIIMALAIVSIFGTGVEMVIIAITIPFIPNCARVVRSGALALKELPYIDAARSVGYSHVRIILRHMIPNVMAPFLIMLTAFVGQAILTEASLSYLGMGVQEPTAAWGLMLQGGAEEYAESAPWVPIWPGVAITLAVFGFNLFGDAVRDVLDPKLRSEA